MSRVPLKLLMLTLLAVLAVSERVAAVDAPVTIALEDLLSPQWTPSTSVAS